MQNENSTNYCTYIPFEYVKFQNFTPFRNKIANFFLVFQYDNVTKIKTITYNIARLHMHFNERDFIKNSDIKN